MVKIVFEGIGGSGKTTLIQGLNKKLKLPYIHDRNISIPKESQNVDSLYLSQNILELELLNKKESQYLLDRSYLSCLAIIYAKERLGIKTSANLKDARKRCEKHPYPNLIICHTNPFSLAIQRRHERDGESHNIWENFDLMKYANEYFINYGPDFSYKSQLIDTSEPVPQKIIDQTLEALI